jgi:hypothetical protein
MMTKLITDGYPYAVGGSINGYMGQVKFMKQSSAEIIFEVFHAMTNVKKVILHVSERLSTAPHFYNASIT